MAISLAGIQTFYNNTFTKLGENGSYLVNTGAGFTTIATILMLPRGPLVQPEEIGSLPLTAFNILIQQSTLTANAIVPKRGDRLLFRGLQYKIEEIDNVSYSYNGTVIAYNFTVGQ
jgi:hypothetical protein